MVTIDLRDYISGPAGTWCDETALQGITFPARFTLADTLRRDRLMLRWGGDRVTLSGPLRVRVTFQAENLIQKIHAVPAPVAANSAGGDSANGSPYGWPGAGQPDVPGANAPRLETLLQASTVYAYVLDIPPGYQWRFVYRLEEPQVGQVPDGSGLLGRNLYDRVLIEPAGREPAAAPVARGDLPCDLAVANHPDTAAFFPAACESCEPGAQVRMPPLAPALSIPSAEGGCTRTRFFNGMSITREDLETEQRYLRVKNQLHNRAIGQGVVWGLDVFREGEQVCVQPGYGIDCCGNDLTLTGVYRVRTEALLRDPAAAAILAAPAGDRPRRMHLLLEYVECPSQPRPVHGDPCAPPQQVCEPSRIRETVRLRLVPPRDPDGSGPIQAFLDAASALHEKYPNAGVGTSAAGDVIAAPYEISSVLAVRTEQGVLEVAGAAPVTIAGRQFRFSARVGEGELTGGRLRIGTEGGVLLGELPLVPSSAGGADELPVDLEPGTSYLLELRDWRAELPPGSAPFGAVTGTTVFRVTARETVAGAAWEIVRREEKVRAAAAASLQGCSAPLPWPWLHADPLCESCPGDPKAALLGILGVWLQASRRTSWQGAVAARLYRAAWLLFYGVDAQADRADVGQALQRMIRGWCAEAIYPGPRCAGEPHGVVIGCATVQGGSLGEIDPFGGRRWVVQYPLIEHWTTRLGLAPPDAVASRLASLLCDVAALSPPAVAGAAPAFVHEIAAGSTSGVEWIAHVAFGTEEGVRCAFSPGSCELTIENTQSLRLVPFAELLIETLGGRLPGLVEKYGLPEQQNHVMRITLGGLFEPAVLSLLFARAA